MSEFTDRQSLIIITAKNPISRLRQELSDLGSELQTHRQIHPSCSDDCVDRNVILFQRSTIKAAIDLKLKPTPPRP